MKPKIGDLIRFDDGDYGVIKHIDEKEDRLWCCWKRTAPAAINIYNKLKHATHEELYDENDCYLNLQVSTSDFKIIKNVLLITNWKKEFEGKI